MKTVEEIKNYLDMEHYSVSDLFKINVTQENGKKRLLACGENIGALEFIKRLQEFINSGDEK